MLIEIESEVLVRLCDAALGYARMNAFMDVTKINVAMVKADQAAKALAISNFETDKKKEKKDELLS